MKHSSGADSGFIVERMLINSEDNNLRLDFGRAELLRGAGSASRFGPTNTERTLGKPLLHISLFGPGSPNSTAIVSCATFNEGLVGHGVLRLRSQDAEGNGGRLVGLVGANYTLCIVGAYVHSNLKPLLHARRGNGLFQELSGHIRLAVAKFICVACTYIVGPRRQMISRFK
jgi:hypothetical protein